MLYQFIHRGEIKLTSACCVLQFCAFVPVFVAGNLPIDFISNFDALVLLLSKYAQHSEPVYVRLLFFGIGHAILATKLAGRIPLRPAKGEL